MESLQACDEGCAFARAGSCVDSVKALQILDSGELLFVKFRPLGGRDRLLKLNYFFHGKDLLLLLNTINEIIRRRTSYHLNHPFLDTKKARQHNADGLNYGFLLSTWGG